MEMGATWFKTASASYCLLDELNIDTSSNTPKASHFETMSCASKNLKFQMPKNLPIE
jgi:hypothetical protein